MGLETQEHFTDNRTTRHKGLLGWWYNLTAPAEPTINASIEERESSRRAKLASTIMLILYILTVPAVVASFLGKNYQMIPLLAGMFFATIIATCCNRRGLVNLTGLIIVVAYSAGMMTNIATAAGGLSLELAPWFTLLIIPEILVAALLSPGMAFAFAPIYIAFSVLAFLFMPRAAGAETNLNIIFSNAVLLPGILQCTVAGISFLWASNLERALRERDRAEEVVRLERDLAEKSEQMIQQKEQLEHSIDVIVQTQATVANGNLNARVPLTADNVLWSVAGTLNNLIARLQRARATEAELEQARTSAAHLAAIIRTRKHGQPTPNYVYKGTMIDTIAMEIFPPQETQKTYRDQAFYTRDTPPPQEAFSTIWKWKTSEV
ncbi:hypothetical protein KSF_021830 [Reticulibacter mediterranei]|uniref:HAMP domain-containing protein n=1 Tax=Reticulibacter mediterranei TaxID=2778369 RepID=A0A8J3IGQ3_9CHLR|nr:hypothetical protein [Reticulibacter mediterranei]GHO92135.1 hypothetical protein KSF_021830 [Reticulibacter mediterranei]